MKIKFEIEIDTISDREEIEDLMKLLNTLKKNWELLKQQEKDK